MRMTTTIGAITGAILALTGCSGQAVGLGGEAGAPLTIADGGGVSSATPAECQYPGLFNGATPDALTSAIVGTWINCGGSLFANTGAPTNEAGIVFRADGTWQKLGEFGGELDLLTGIGATGVWSVYPGGCCGAMLALKWGASELDAGAEFSTDGRTIFASTAALGNNVTLAKATGTP